MTGLRRSCDRRGLVYRRGRVTRLGGGTGGCRRNARRTQIRRLERQLVNLRWLVAAFGAVQVGFAIRDQGDGPVLRAPARESPWSSGSTIGNLAICQLGPRAGRPRRSSRGRARGVRARRRRDPRPGLARPRAAPADPVWVIGYLLPLEGAARWGLRGGLVGAAVPRRGVVPRDDPRTDAAGTTRQVGLAFRAGMAFVVGGGGRARSCSSAPDRATRPARPGGGGGAGSAREESAASRSAQAQRRGGRLPRRGDRRAPSRSDRRETLRATAEAGRDASSSARRSALLVRATRRPSARTEFVAPACPATPGTSAASPVPRLAARSRRWSTEGDGRLDDARRSSCRCACAGASSARCTSGAPDGDRPDEGRLLLLSRLADQLGVVLEATRLRAEQEATVDRLDASSTR